MFRLLLISTFVFVVCLHLQNLIHCLQFNLIRQDIVVSCDIYLETEDSGVFVAARVDRSGESVQSAQGVFYWVFANGTYKVTNDIGQWAILYLLLFHQQFCVFKSLKMHWVLSSCLRWRKSSCWRTVRDKTGYMAHAYSHSKGKNFL